MRIEGIDRGGAPVIATSIVVDADSAEVDIKGAGGEVKDSTRFLLVGFAVSGIKPSPVL